MPTEVELPAPEGETPADEAEEVTEPEVEVESCLSPLCWFES